MAENVHPAAATGFALASDAYERGRPDYPRAAVEFLFVGQQVAQHTAAVIRLEVCEMV